ncbi:hypothetical protein [Actinoplanes sp. NPDC026619]|uniref:hypothetical protein n=1 Tax=Actinoplanes sp. NPDC026619 TaxID=3155798 RepID=UPI0033D19B28
MDQEFEAYAAGRADGLAARRDVERAGDPAFGRDYRIGFLDGRLEVFRMLAGVRKIVEDD